MVFDINEDIVLTGFRNEMVVLREVLDSRLCDQNVETATDGVESDGVVCCVWGEDCDGVAGGERFDSSLVGFWIAGGGV